MEKITRPLLVNFDKITKLKLKILAAKWEKSMNFLVRQAVREFLIKHGER